MNMTIPHRFLFHSYSPGAKGCTLGAFVAKTDADGHDVLSGPPPDSTLMVTSSWEGPAGAQSLRKRELVVLFSVRLGEVSSFWNCCYKPHGEAFGRGDWRRTQTQRHFKLYLLSCLFIKVESICFLFWSVGLSFGCFFR